MLIRKGYVLVFSPKLLCSGFCPQVLITLQNNLFTIPFHLLPIEGADVVLGMEWLCTLGPLIVDFSIPKISFSYNSNDITITRESKSIPSPSSYNSLCHMLHTDYVASMNLLYTTIFQNRIKTSTSITPIALTCYQLLSENKIPKLLNPSAPFFKHPEAYPQLANMTTRSLFCQTPHQLMLNHTATPIPKKTS